VGWREGDLERGIEGGDEERWREGEGKKEIEISFRQ
jgi:hypothetical protein